MALIEAVAAVLSKYMTIWPRVVDERTVLETYTCTDDTWLPNVTGSAQTARIAATECACALSCFN